MNIQQLLSKLKNQEIEIDYKGHQVNDFIPELQKRIDRMIEVRDTGSNAFNGYEKIVLKRDLPLRTPIITMPFQHLTADCKLCDSTLLPILIHEDTLTFADRIIVYSSELFRSSLPLDFNYFTKCVASLETGILHDYNHKCWDCGCTTFTFSRTEFLHDYECRVRCRDCKRLLEGDRAKQKFVDNCLLPPSDYMNLVLRTMKLIKKAQGVDEDLLELFSASEFRFLKLPECENTIMTLKGIIGFHQWCIDHNCSEIFLMDALHDITECNKNFHEEWFSPRTNPYVDYKKGGK